MIVRLFESPLWAIHSPRYSEKLRYTAKSVPGMSWRGPQLSWVGYPDAVNLCVNKLEALNVKLDGERPRRRRYHNLPLPKQIAKGLRDYQKLGVQFLIAHAHSGALLADDMGLGKTLTAIRAMKALGGSAIIVCPSFVRMTWKRELQKWRPKAKIVELWGTKPSEKTRKRLQKVARKRNTVVVLHYDIVHAWVQPLLTAGFHTVVFDEAHYLQSEKSRRSAACRTIAASCKARIGLTGTPMTSRPRDLWNVIETLSPGRMGKPFDFFIRYCNAHRESITMRTGARVVWNTDGASNLEELRDRLSWFMLRRIKSEVALELPPRTRQAIEVEVPETNIRSTHLAGRADRIMRETMALAADGKLPKAIELIRSHVDAGSKVVVFCHRVAIAEALCAAFVADGIHARAITGNVTSFTKRQEIVDEKPTVLCATMDATAVGIDFSFADVGVFVELDWVPSKLLQAEARLHRFGQQSPVLIQYVIALRTVDEIIRDAVIEKLQNFEIGVGKTDDKLRVELDKNAELTSAERLLKLTKRLMTMVEEGKA